MIMEPEYIPQEPRPAMARPIISPRELGVAPQIKDPISKIPSAVRYTHLVE
jgi:hypothetical protein